MLPGSCQIKPPLPVRRQRAHLGTVLGREVRAENHRATGKTPEPADRNVRAT
jgi:hypothetical protein